MRCKSRYFWAGLLLALCLGTGLALDYDISVPETVTPGEWFSVNVTASSDVPVEFTAYSYIYSGYNNVGQGWTSNKKEISLGQGEEKQFSLDDLVKFGTEEGWYNLRVRFKTSGENITETFDVRVIENENKFALKETYLYVILISVCIIGVLLAFKYNR